MIPELDIEWIFSHHAPPNERVAQAHQNVRFQVKSVAHLFNETLPDCPEKTIAIRKLQEAMMFANSAIAQHSE